MRRCVLILCAVLAACSARHDSRPPTFVYRTRGEPPPAPERDTLLPPVDSEIRAMVNAVDARRIEADVRKLVSFGTRHSLSERESDTRGIGAATRWVKARLEEARVVSGGRLEVRLEDYTAPAGRRVPEPTPMQNVVAVLPGTDEGPRARTLVVSGHLDSRALDGMDRESDAPGANDDASGVAVVLEACRVMAPHRFRATLVFAAVTGEEQGLLGSKALAQRMRESGIRVEGMLNDDVVGASVGPTGEADKEHVRVFSAGLPSDPGLRDAFLAVAGESDGPSRQLARAVHEAATAYVEGFATMLVFRLDRYLRGGDHRSFHEAGFPSVRFTEVYENHRFQHEDVRVEDGVEYGDTLDPLDFAYVVNVTRVNVAALASLARAPAAPDPVRLDVRALSSDSRILWIPDPDPAVTYEVVARPTDAPRWMRSFEAGRSGEVVVPLSKDHWNLGLRAVGPDGHRSRAVFPLPLRGGDPWLPE